MQMLNLINIGWKLYIFKMKKNKITLIGGRMFEKYLDNPCNHWRSLRIAQQWGDKDILIQILCLAVIIF